MKKRQASYFFSTSRFHFRFLFSLNKKTATPMFQMTLFTVPDWKIIPLGFLITLVQLDTAQVYRQKGPGWKTSTWSPWSCDPCQFLKNELWKNPYLLTQNPQLGKGFGVLDAIQLHSGKCNASAVLEQFFLILLSANLQRSGCSWTELSCSDGNHFCS